MLLLYTIAGALTALPVHDDQILKSRDGACQASVPSGWAINTMLATASAPDKSQSITVSSPKMIDSFAELKQAARTTYKQSKVTKDSPTEFEMEGQSITGKPDVYRAIPGASGKYCIAEVIYDGKATDAARGIVRTLKAAKP